MQGFLGSPSIWGKNWFFDTSLIDFELLYGVGATTAAAQAAMQVLKAVLHPARAGVAAITDPVKKKVDRI